MAKWTKEKIVETMKRRGYYSLVSENHTDTNNSSYTFMSKEEPEYIVQVRADGSYSFRYALPCSLSYLNLETAIGFENEAQFNSLCRVFKNDMYRIAINSF